MAVEKQILERRVLEQSERQMVNMQTNDYFNCFGAKIV